MKRRVMTALAIILIVAIPVLLGGWPLELLALFIVASTGYEWMHAEREYTVWPQWIPILIVVLVVISRWIPSNFDLAYYVTSIIFIWSLPVFFESVTLNNSFSFLAYFLIFSLIYRAIGFIQLNHFYLITICFATYGSDTGAYLIGSKFGKNKMNPRISPKKSWEGFLGGIVFGGICGMAVSMFYLDQINSLANVILCLICPITAELGDLCFSAMKRHFHIKDFSDLLPGHGGVLDRVDSLMMNLMVFIIVYTIML